MAKTKRKPISDRATGWNEFNTFSKLIYPYLEETLGYPPRKSEAFDEQTWVRKRGEKSGPYDGAFKDDRGVLVLIEAKKQGKPLGAAEMKQAFDYCLGETFPVPPPYVLVSNGDQNKWFRRNKNAKGEYSYSPCDEVKWKKAKQESGSGELTEQLTLKELIRLLSKLRKVVYRDLVETYFPDKFSLKKNKLGGRKKGFEEVLKTRKTFVDPTLADAEETKAIQFVLSSVALSITLKFLFIKIICDRKSEIFPKELKKKIKSLSKAFPGILIAKPYDVLDISKNCEEEVVRLLKPVSILHGLEFESSDNPIGDIWDGLVESEEHDLQVESLGNVYTPDPIVKSMVNSAENVLESWRGKYILEPSCGSGHFVREIYRRLRDTYLTSESGARVRPARAHLLAMSHLRAIDIDPFAVQTTQLGMFLELYREQLVWREIAPKGNFNFSSVVDRADFLETGFFSKIGSFTPDLVIGNPPYGVKVSDEVKNRFALGNDDSYGCFIVRGLELLSQRGCLSFVVSNTFMTTKTHQELREIIFRDARVDKVLQLHRAAFRGRDVFCCLIELVKESVPNNNYFYRYCDSWPIHPTSSEYLSALGNYGSAGSFVIPPERYVEYQANAQWAGLRRNPPTLKQLENLYDTRQLTGIRSLVRTQKAPFPICGGNQSLFLLVADIEFPGLIASSVAEFPTLGEIDCLEISRRENSNSRLIKLWQVARVITGLQTSDDERFLRKTPGVVPNARRRYIKDVDLNLTLRDVQLRGIPDSQMTDGISIIDRSSTPHFVPFDKGGEQDIESGDLRSFWSPVDYWIDWSYDSVQELKKRNRSKSKGVKRPRFQNSQFYFQEGIRFSPAGLYAPMFELSFGGVPGHKGSLILPIQASIVNYLLGVLCSPVIRYLTKNFLQHTVMTEADIIKQIPVPVPTAAIFQEVSQLVAEVILAKQSGRDFEATHSAINRRIGELFGLDTNEYLEIDMWMRRRYPNLGRPQP